MNVCSIEKSEERENEVLSFNYKAFKVMFLLLLIIGMAFGVNEHGFAYALNGLYPNYVARRRLPRQIANRALLSIKNEQELDNLCRTNAVAFGFCINGGFFRQQNYLLNYEIGPNLNIDNHNYISKCLVLNNDQKENRKYGKKNFH